MKTIFKAIFIAITLSSCNAEVKTEIIGNKISQILVSESEAQTAHFSQTRGENDATQQKDSSLIGKTTIEIENMGWFNCAGTIIDSDQNGGKYAVSQLAKSQKECRNGSGKILLERFVSRRGNKAMFEVIDEINIQSSYPEKGYNWTTCRINGNNEGGFYIIHLKTSGRLSSQKSMICGV